MLTCPSHSCSKDPVKNHAIKNCFFCQLDFSSKIELPQLGLTRAGKFQLGLPRAGKFQLELISTRNTTPEGSNSACFSLFVKQKPCNLLCLNYERPLVIFNMYIQSYFSQEKVQQIYLGIQRQRAAIVLPIQQRIAPLIGGVTIVDLNY